MQQQPPTQMIPMMSSFPQTNITTEQIQKYLDENKKLILAILDNQNLGKLAECAQYQAQLQKNLMYLAAIADAQPPTPTIPPQMFSHPAMQQAGYYMQHPQVSTKAPQPGISPPKMPMQFNSPHLIQDPQQLHQQHQQAMHGQMGVRPMGHNNVMHPMHHTETTVGAGGSGGPPYVGPNESRGGSNQRTSDAGTTGAVGHGSGDRKEAI